MGVMPDDSGMMTSAGRWEMGWKVCFRLVISIKRRGEFRASLSSCDEVEVRLNADCSDARVSDTWKKKHRKRR